MQQRKRDARRIATRIFFSNFNSYYNNRNPKHAPNIYNHTYIKNHPRHNPAIYNSYNFDSYRHIVYFIKKTFKLS